MGCYGGIKAMDLTQCAGKDAEPLTGGGPRYPVTGVEENEPCLVSVETPQQIEAPFGDKTVRGALDSG